MKTYAPSKDRPLAVAFPYFPPEEQERLKEELGEILNGKLSAGPRGARFEKEFAAFSGAAHGVAFPTCTASIEAALTAMGVGPGDEVLVPVQTFVATAMAVHLVGARPVFVEVTGDTFAMDFDDARARMTERTRGAIVVYFGGVIPAGLPAFAEEMRAAGRFVLEDCAHAHGAELGGRRAGSLADAGVFSFYPTKVMTTGEGGMLTTDDADLAKKVRSLQNRGLDLDSPVESYIAVGRNGRFPEISAAMGLSQLRTLPEFLRARRAVAAEYDERLTGSDLLRPLLAPEGSRPSYWRYTVFLDVELDREALRDALKEDAITIDWAYDPPVHLQPVFRQLYGTEPGDLPVSEALMRRHVCLPIHPRLLPEDATYVAERLLHHVGRLADG